MKLRDFERHLREHGCEFVRECGRHTVWHNPANGRTSTVPRHNEMKNGLARKVCADLGIADPFSR